MSSSTQNSGATAAPPPTPSHADNHHFPTSDASDLLSQLLHRLPPTLSLPSRRTSSSAPSPPSISFTNASSDELLAQHGYFQLVDHPITSKLAHAAVSDSVSLFNLPREKKHTVFPSKWPIGFDYDEDINELFCGDASTFSEAATEVDINSLTELTREMEKIGHKMVEMLMSDLKDPTRELRYLMWISAEESSVQDQLININRAYPYILCLTYQLRPQQKYSLLGDSGWVTVCPQVDSVLVTIGDIAQVWSNGLTKKVQGRPVPNMGGESSIKNENSPSCITMTLLVTLEADSIVQPLVLPNAGPTEKSTDETEASTSSQTCPDNLVFKPFSLEDYAWRVYNERIILRDPLDRFRV